jgi:hypothetical protein
MSSVYREPARPKKKDPEAPPTELDFNPVDRSTGTSQGAIMVVIGIPILAGAALAALVHPIVGLLGMIGTGYWGWKRRHGAASGTGEGAILEVKEGVLRVHLKHANDVGRFQLKQIHAVELELRKVERLQEAGAIPGLRLQNATVAGAIDNGRIVIVSKTKRFTLTKSYFSNTDSTEWLGRIRVFLRKHGWVPLDERGDQAVDDVVSDFGEEAD